MKKILHVTESLGGGVATALRDYVSNAPQHQHFLLAATPPPGAHDKMEWLGQFAAHWVLPRNVLPAVVTLQKVYREIKPDWVHLHSSFAGGYGRIAFLPRRKIIYTPHCYAFERRDIGRLRRFGYYIAEQFLCSGGRTTAASSPREFYLAAKMLLSQHTVLLPYAADVPQAILELRVRAPRNNPLRIAMVGRIAPQKDPKFFLETVRLARARGIVAEFLWLGGGDPAIEKDLRALDVNVTGWLDREALLAKLAECDVYFHCAAWESCPLSLLEASRLGLLLLCRDIPPIAALPVDPIIPSPKSAVDAIAQLVAGENWGLFQKINPVLNQHYNNETQKAALLHLYGE